MYQADALGLSVVRYFGGIQAIQARQPGHIPGPVSRAYGITLP